MSWFRRRYIPGDFVFIVTIGDTIAFSMGEFCPSAFIDPDLLVQDAADPGGDRVFDARLVCRDD